MNKLKTVLKFSAAATLASVAMGTSLNAANQLPVSAPTKVGTEPALEILKQITHNPVLAHSVNARKEALLTTGSVVKSGGVDRVLYHLPATEQGLRLKGETASMEWPVHIARQQLGGDVVMRIGYKNAVSVMPEASHLALEVNGVLIGKQTIQSPDRSRVLNFPVPSHILVPGFNSVRLVARQRHRVDCTIKATHELWTDIDPAKTGLVFTKGNSALNTLDAVAAIARNKAGQVKMRLLLPDNRDATQTGRVMLMGQHTAIYAEFETPIVETAAMPGQGPGLDIFTGTLSDLRKIAPEYAKVARNTGGLQIIAEDGNERVALILITGELTNDRDQEKFSNLLKELFPKKNQRGSAHGLRTANMLSNNQVREGQRVPFSHLGLQSQEFDGRLFRRSFQINLPSDYFAADYNQAEMHLATGYAAGLTRGNKFVIRVNGATATGFALSNPSGHIFHDKMLRLPLSSFKPGVNHIELEAQLASKDDATCDPAQQIKGEKRFVISGKSWIKFPRLAHLARLPDLAGTISSGFPYVIGGKAQPTTIAVPNPNFAALSAAAGFATKVAVNSGVPLDFELKYGAANEGTKNAIIVATFGELPRKLAKSIKGIDHSAFQTAWQNSNQLTRNRQVALLGLSNDEYGVDTMSTASISKVEIPAPDFDSNDAAVNLDAFSAANKTDDPLDRWSSGSFEEQTAKDNEALSFSGHVSTLFASFVGAGKQQLVETPTITNPNSDILISQKVAPAHEKGVWTVLTARNDQAFQSGMSMLSKPAIAARVRGETATINGVDRTVTATVTQQSYVQVRSFSLRNMHLIVAGWFSNNHHVYSLLMLIALIGFRLASTRVLKTVGVDREKEEGLTHE